MLIENVRHQKGFTIVELLIVVVVIAILAAITIVTFNGINNRAIESSIQTELRQVSNKVGTYYAEKGSYPSNLNATDLSSDESSKYTYVTDEFSFCVSRSTPNASKTFSITQDGSLTESPCGPPTASAGCFAFDAGTIWEYRDFANPSCPMQFSIPSEINGEAVVEIQDNAFNNRAIVSVGIPNGVTTIGIGAFENNQITSLIIPASVTLIREYAFYGNQLSSVAIPNGTTLETNAFDPAVTIHRY